MGYRSLRTISKTSFAKQQNRDCKSYAEGLSTEVERFPWQRNKVLELSSEGRSQPQIASVLQVSLDTFNIDLEYLRQETKQEM